MALDMKYFVLNPHGNDGHAKASRAAMNAYAAVIRAEDPERADALREWAEREHNAARDDEQREAMTPGEPVAPEAPEA